MFSGTPLFPTTSYWHFHLSCDIWHLPGHTSQNDSFHLYLSPRLYISANVPCLFRNLHPSFPSTWILLPRGSSLQTEYWREWKKGDGMKWTKTRFHHDFTSTRRRNKKKKRKKESCIYAEKGADFKTWNIHLGPSLFLTQWGRLADIPLFSIFLPSIFPTLLFFGATHGLSTQNIKERVFSFHLTGWFKFWRLEENEKNSKRCWMFLSTYFGNKSYSRKGVPNWEILLAFSERIMKTHFFFQKV